MNNYKHITKGREYKRGRRRQSKWGRGREDKMRMRKKRPGEEGKDARKGEWEEVGQEKNCGRMRKDGMGKGGEESGPHRDGNRMGRRGGGGPEGGKEVTDVGRGGHWYPFPSGHPFLSPLPGTHARGWRGGRWGRWEIGHVGRKPVRVKGRQGRVYERKGGRGHVVAGYMSGREVGSMW